MSEETWMRVIANLSLLGSVSMVAGCNLFEMQYLWSEGVLTQRDVFIYLGFLSALLGLFFLLAWIINRPEKI